MLSPIKVPSFENLNRYQPARSPVGFCLCSFEFSNAYYGLYNNAVKLSQFTEWGFSRCKTPFIIFGALCKSWLVCCGEQGVTSEEEEAISSVEGHARRISFTTSYIFSYNESQLGFDSNDLWNDFFLTILLSCVRFLSHSYV